MRFDGAVSLSPIRGFPVLCGVAACSATTSASIGSARNAYVEVLPSGWLAQPEEVAPMVVFLASDESSDAAGECSDSMELSLPE